MPKVSKREVKKAINEEETMAMPAVIPAATPTTAVHFSAEFAPRRFVVYSRFNEQDWIHVREYVTYGERTYPSKKGVAFTPARLRTLMNKMEGDRRTAEAIERKRLLQSRASFVQ